jgi:hypothetical protein
MAKTLEEIKGINIAVGTPIEIEVESPLEKYTVIGYFVDISKDHLIKDEYKLRYSSHKLDEDTINENKQYIISSLSSSIEDIKILDYKK